MPALAALLPLSLLALLAAPASAQDGGNPADVGFPIAMVVLIVVATAFALIWRARSKKDQDR